MISGLRRTAAGRRDQPPCYNAPCRPWVNCWHSPSLQEEGSQATQMAPHYVDAW